MRPGGARNREELVAAYDEHRRRAARQIKIPAGSAPPEIAPTGVPFGGILRDARKRFPFYRADFRDGLHIKVVASIFFMYFACLAPAVAFGGLMSVMTKGQIGIVEMIVATSVCGIIYSLVSAQPLTILAGTGPLLIFTGILYELCGSLELPFLPAYAWVGLWTGLFLFVAAVFDAAALIRFITRFTDEIFAALIALIFIAEAVKDLVKVFTDQAVSNDTALLSLLLALGTYFVAMSLARFRRSLYLRHQFREFLADFGPTIAIGTMTVVAVLLSQVELRRLPLPESIEIHRVQARIVDLFALPTWAIAAASVPALLGTVLIFLNQNVTTRLVDSPDNHLQRPTGYHLNLAVVGLLVAACSPFGFPWLMASVIPSLNHMRSLANVDEIVTANGETREKVVSVRENRVSPLLIHVLIGLSLLLLPVLRTIPMAVLFGLFLYMGVASLAANQFFERLKLWLMDPALYPPTHYIRKLPIWSVHSYTMIQALCLAILWVVKASPAGILFPLLIGLLVPLRLIVLPRIFDRKALSLLDAAGVERTHEDVPAVLEEPTRAPISEAARGAGGNAIKPESSTDQEPRIITSDSGLRPGRDPR